MNNPYHIRITPHARRALAERLPLTVACAVMEFLQGSLAANPQRVGALLRAPFAGYWRARRGEYRVRYEIDESSHAVVVHVVEHRRNIYRS